MCWPRPFLHSFQIHHVWSNLSRDKNVTNVTLKWYCVCAISYCIFTFSTVTGWSDIAFVLSYCIITFQLWPVGVIQRLCYCIVFYFFNCDWLEWYSICAIVLFFTFSTVTGWSDIAFVLSRYIITWTLL